MARWLIFIFLWSSSSWAYLTHQTTGEVLDKGHYRSGLNAQFVTTEFAGVNLNGFFDIPLTKDSEARAVVGFGKVDFHLGGLYKWVPFPDLERQPAVGLTAGPIYGRVNGKNVLTIRTVPFVSKRFESEEAGSVSPYAGIPFGIEFAEGTTNVPTQFMFGCDWRPAALQKIHFTGEAALSLSKSFSYIAVGAVVHFDDSNGFRFE